MADKPIFTLSDGTGVFKGTILYHPDLKKVGWYCIAQFETNDPDYVRVMTDNGAVPIVRISDLAKAPPVQHRCTRCGQLLPEDK